MAAAAKFKLEDDVKKDLGQFLRNKYPDEKEISNRINPNLTDLLDLNKGNVRLFDVEDSHISEAFIKTLEQIIP